ncbi:SUMF1/EgtB/PvdO family nonheme iron enzyme [Actinoallomurus sp. CA-150999]|uniref:SUMF1/EgtB/PvdO family nonheme iron enzyme n=1 Tax=Actinoallomurus sp. CA-150999 TaxID=3239887 RepID=UPI003D8C3C44
MASDPASGAGGRLAHELRSLQAGGQQSDLDEALTAYLRKVKARLGYTDVITGPGRRDRVALDEVYVPVPVDVAVSVTIQDGVVADAWLEDNSAAASDSPQSYARERGAARTATFDAANHKAMSQLTAVITEAISRGVDADYMDPATRPLIAAPPWYDGTRQRFWPLCAEDAAHLWGRLILLGAPGSGKSTFLRYAAQVEASRLLGADDPPAGHMLGMLRPPMVPIYVELRKVFSYGDGIDVDDVVDESLLWNYLSYEFDRLSPSPVSSILRREALRGQAIIMLDGIDEIPVPQGRGSLTKRRRQIRDLARALNVICPKSPIMMSGRDYAYRDWIIEGFQRVSIMPLRAQDVRRLLTNLGRTRALAQNELSTEINALSDALDMVPESLRNYPLFVSLMASLYWTQSRNALPNTRADLYRESIDLLLERWTSSAADEPPLTELLGCTRQDIEHRLRRVAYETHCQGAGAEVGAVDIEFSVLVTELFRLGAQTDPHKVLAYLSEYAGVLIAQDPEHFRFAHRGFQEYFAAGYMAALLDEADDTDDSCTASRKVRRIFESSPLLWREPCLMLGEILNGQGGRDKAWDLVAELVRRETSEPSDQQSADWNLWLASRLIFDSSMYRRMGIREAPLIDDLRHKLPGIMSSRNLQAPERVDCGYCLGAIGDRRPGIGVDESGVPTPTMCWIPAGIYTIGATDDLAAQISEQPWARGWAFGREMPDGTLELRDFEIARYPVTVTQFKAFVDAADGYRDDAWWLPAGIEWKRDRREVSHLRSNSIGNLPQTHVSWYEAHAFCRWLSARSGFFYRLPTEAEWEAAARYSSIGWFQWGDEFDVQACNSAASGFGHAVPVGCYEGYLGPRSELPTDLCGNIWEWTSTAATGANGEEFAYPYRPDGRENEMLSRPGLYRVVRGGSYINPPFLLRITYRGRDEATAQIGRAGFRLARSLYRERKDD